MAWLQRFPAKRNISDVGTGSGAIAVSIAAHVPDAQILAIDISPKALQVAKHNAQKHRLSKSIHFVECDLLPARNSEKYPALDLLCANLPYIPTETLQGLAIFGREPSLALDGGPDGLDLYRRLFSLAPDWLAADGKMLFEIEATQGKPILALANSAFGNAITHLHKDISGHDRLLEITLPGS
jgi:release factor glutamine methyltransferase